MATKRSGPPAVRQSAASFFRAKESGKCSTCPITLQKSTVNFKHDSGIIRKAGTGDDVWVVMEMPEPRHHTQELEYQLRAAGIENYTLYVGLQCQTLGFEVPSPIYSSFKNCNTIQDQLPPKAIVTIGRAINAVTQSDDLISWREFVEAQFNPSYFYTSHWWSHKVRTYPIPALFDWVNKDNYEKVYVKQQLLRVQKFVQPENYQALDYYKPQVQIVEDPNKFLLEHTARACEVVLDLETSSLYHFADDFSIGCLTLAFDDKTGYYLRWKDIDPQILDNFLANKTQIYANGKFDTKAMIVKAGIKNAVVHHDIVLLFHTLSTERISNGLKALAWLVGDGGYDGPLEDYKRRYAPKSYLDIPEEILSVYATLDAVVTFKLYKLGKRLARAQAGVFSVYKNKYVPVIPVFEDMEILGLDVNKQKLVALHKQLVRDAAAIEAEILAELNAPDLLLTSAEQLGRVLERAGFPNLGKGEKNVYKTGAEELQKWSKQGYKVCDKILRYRSLTKLDASFVGELVEDDPSLTKAENFFHRNSERRPKGKGKKKRKANGIVQHLRSDGKVHTTYGPALTDSGRSKSWDPNLQNQTKHSEEAQQFRSIFECPKNGKIWEADYDGFQLRIGCILSGDPVMEDIFLNRGGDMHSITGHGVFARRITLEEFFAQLKVEDPLIAAYRQRAKPVNFGFLFGRSALSFKADLELSWSEEEVLQFISDNNLEVLYDRNSDQPDYYLTVATELRARFFKTYPRLEQWIEECREEGRRQGYIDSIFGGRRHTPWLRYKGEDVDGARWSNYQNIAVNSRVQNFEAITVYESMVKIRQAIKREKMKSSLRFMVHDSIGGYVINEEAAEFYHLLKENMEVLKTYRIPLTCEVKYGDIWGFGKKVTAANALEWTKPVGVGSTSISLAR